MAGIVETRWWWIRHSPVVNPGGLIYGQSEVPADLSDRRPVTALARHLPAAAQWIVTPLSRTRLTAAALIEAGAPGPADGIAGAAVEPAFLEQSFGDWHGRTYDEVAPVSAGRRHPFWLAAASYRPPGGESFVEVMDRVGPAMDRWSNRAPAGASGRDIVVVAHGGTIRAAIGKALDLQPEAALRIRVDTLSLTRLDHLADGKDGQWCLFASNVTLSSLS